MAPASMDAKSACASMGPPRCPASSGTSCSASKIRPSCSAEASSNAAVAESMASSPATAVPACSSSRTRCCSATAESSSEWMNVSSAASCTARTRRRVVNAESRAAPLLSLTLAIISSIFRSWDFISSEPVRPCLLSAPWSLFLLEGRWVFDRCGAGHTHVDRFCKAGVTDSNAKGGTSMDSDLPPTAPRKGRVRCSGSWPPSSTPRLTALRFTTPSA